MYSSPAREPVHPPPKLSKACIFCHARKLKCDAPVVGLPCTRCKDKGRAGSCVQAYRRPRGSRTTKSWGGQPSPRVKEGRNTFDPSADVDQYRANLPLNDTNGPASVRSNGPGSINQDDDSTVQEGKARLRVCREIAMGNGLPSPDKMLAPASPGWDVVEYHNGIHYLSILGDVVSGHKRRRLTRIVVNDSETAMSTDTDSPERQDLLTQGQQAELAGLDAADREFLLKKEVFELPVKPLCDMLLRTYFEFVYPYAPVFNRVQFMESYRSNQASYFLLQAILANATLHAPIDLLRQCGFEDRQAAQKSFILKATLLYDFHCERSQLRLLQGSYLMSTTSITDAVDKDYRYWFHNAVRLAVKMGLHRNDIREDIDPATYKLYRRTWWSIYLPIKCRDVLLSFMGVENIRILDMTDSDTTPLTPDDWEDGAIPAQYASVLVPISHNEKLFFIENCKLSVIGAHCLSRLKQRRGAEMESLIQPIIGWRASLPSPLLVHPDHSARDRLWHMVLLATGYRFEAILLRISCIHCQDQERQVLIKQQLRVSTFELDAIIGRSVAYGMMSIVPMSFITCVLSVLAIRIEMALDKTESEDARQIYCSHIRTEIVFLRQLRDVTTISRVLHVFEWVLAQKNVLAANELKLPTETWSQSASEVQADSDSDNAAAQASATADVPFDCPPLQEMPGQWFEDVLGFEFLDGLELPGM